MNDGSTNAISRYIKVPFRGSELYVVEHNGEPYTPMRGIVEGMGLAWQPQHRKLQDSRFSTCVTEMVMQLPGDSQRRSVTCMPLRKLPGWLMSIEPGKVKDEMVRARVVQYQSECDDALWQYWNDGIAINPRIGFSVNPGDVLTGDQQETLRLMVKTLVERLPRSKQGPATIRMWSKLKAHFKVGYRQIPQSEFTEAVSIVTRTAADWEVLEDSPEPSGIRFAVPGYGRYLVVSSALGSFVYNVHGMQLVAADEVARMKMEMMALSEALTHMGSRLRGFDGGERSALLRPIAVDMHVL